MHPIRFIISLLILCYVAVIEWLDNQRNEEAAT